MRKHMFLGIMALIMLNTGCSKPSAKIENKKQSININEIFSDNFIGFNQWHPISIELGPSNLPNLDENSLEFYKKYSGIYINTQINSLKWLPITNLITIKRTWGSEYSFITNYNVIDYYAADSSFYYGYDDRSIKITDISQFTIPNGWIRISSYMNRGQYIKEYIDRKMNQYKNIGESIDNKNEEKNAILLLQKICNYNEKEISGLISKKYGLTMDKPNTIVIRRNEIKRIVENINKAKKPKDYFDSNNKQRLFENTIEDLISRIEHCSFSIEINKYYNEDEEYFDKTYPDVKYLEFIFAKSSEYFAIAMDIENNSYNVVFIKNGMSDL